MSRAFQPLLLAFALALGLASVDGAAADRYRQPKHGAPQIRCESEGHRHTYCRTWTHGRVRLVRRLSKSPCREYDTWGADRDGGGIWVREGCRADFVVLPYGSSGGHVHRRGGGYHVTCESDRFRPAYCPLPRWGRVRLEKRLSDAPCRQYDTWGADGGGIWVDRGCAAIFFVH
jgi:hypothetical protein